ncbi:MAG: hypothetical protein WCH21_05985 [Bacteroidota bacterium]
MKEKIIEKLKHIEDHLGIYSKATNDPTYPADDRGVVSFKMMYEMIAFATLSELVPEYKANETTDILVAQGLRNMKDLVSVQDGKIVVSSEYKELLKHKEEFLKNQQNGQVGKI